jgi:hypothetical protein
MDNESTLTIDLYGNKEWRNAEGLLHRLDGPAAEWVNRNKKWWKNGNLHRLDGPAIEYLDGYKVWYKNGVLHCEDGPAVITSDGFKTWCLNGIIYKTKEEYFNSLSDKAKAKCLFNEDFLNG